VIRGDIFLLDCMPVELRWSIEGTAVQLERPELTRRDPLKATGRSAVTVIITSEITKGSVASQTRRITGRYILTLEQYAIKTVRAALSLSSR
jgi:hypothetical protein